MATGQLSNFIRRLRSVLVRQDAPGLADDDLLKLYLQQREESAFEALVRRHGPMVMGVCRRVLHNSHDAEDAFQATFLVLVRKAGTLRSPALVANWLHGVAYRTALQARKHAAKRRAKEANVPRESQTPEDTWADLRPVLDRELQRLPAKYRAVLVLCDLEGKTRKEAARRIGCPEGTVASRLASARVMLAKRLSSYVPAISGGVLATMLSENAWADVPNSLMSITTKAATLFAAGKTALASSKVAALAEGVLKTMLVAKIKIATAVFVAMGLAGYSVVLLACAALAFAQSDNPKSTSHLGATPSGGNGQADDPATPGKPKVLHHDASLGHMVWSPDGKVLACESSTFELEEKIINGEKTKVYACANSTVMFWDVAKGEVILSLGKEKKVRITSLAYSPDGKTLAVAAEDRGAPQMDAYMVRLFDTQTGALKKTIPHPGTISAVVYSADGKLLAIGGQYRAEQQTGPFERTIRLWNLAKEKVTTDFKQKLELPQTQIEKEGYLDGLGALAFSPDGQLLASADIDYKIRLLDIPTGQLTKTLEGQTSAIMALRFSPNGKMLVSGSRNPEGTAKVWDVNRGKLLKNLEGSEDHIVSVDFSPDGKLLATGGARQQDKKYVGQVILWDTHSWQPKQVLSEGIHSAVAFSPSDGKTLAINTERITGFCESTSDIKLWRVSDLLTENK